MEDLPDEAAARAARLAGVGARSGAVVVGLSAVRRTKDLALVFVDASVSQNTQRELDGLTRRGARVLRCADLGTMTAPMGRTDASVVGVRRGPLAAGMIDLLPPESVA